MLRSKLRPGLAAKLARVQPREMRTSTIQRNAASSALATTKSSGFLSRFFSDEPSNVPALYEALPGLKLAVTLPDKAPATPTKITSLFRELPFKGIQLRAYPSLQFKGIQLRAYSGIQGPPGGPFGQAGSEGFGDLTAQSAVTDDMLDSLIALKDFGNIEGLPPLDQILEEDEERDKKAMRRELEMKKQLEIESKRVKTVDELGRAYGTGRRKASTARVWIKEGEGRITVNGKPHDLYFPDIDQRLQLLEPFWETNQLGTFDVRATVKGGGVSGQSGALRHGISKALQLYDPTLRPALKSAGMLTRDSRVVERKKPGKAKARKSFQWVKR